MNASKPTRVTIFLTLFAVVCVIAAASLRTIRPVTANVKDPVLDALNAQMRELEAFSPQRLAAARQARLTAESRLWTQDKLAEWRASVPSDKWLVQEMTQSASVFTTQRRFQISRVAPLFREWPEMLGFVTSLAEKPSIEIHSLVLTAPPGSKRSFNKLSMLVGFATAKPQKPNQPPTP